MPFPSYKKAAPKKQTNKQTKNRQRMPSFAISHIVKPFPFAIRQDHHAPFPFCKSGRLTPFGQTVHNISSQPDLNHDDDSLRQFAPTYCVPPPPPSPPETKQNNKKTKKQKKTKKTNKQRTKETDALKLDTQTCFHVLNVNNSFTRQIRSVCFILKDCNFFLFFFL